MGAAVFTTDSGEVKDKLTPSLNNRGARAGIRGCCRAASEPKALRLKELQRLGDGLEVAHVEDLEALVDPFG